MSKVNTEQRIQAVERYINGNESMNQIAKNIGVSSVVLRGWIRLYEAYGSEAFLKSYTNHSAEFKMDVLTYMNETGASSIDADAFFNISSSGVIQN